MSQDLPSRMATVNMGSVSVIGGLFSGFTIEDVRALEDFVMRAGIAQALIDNIASQESGLVVRDVLPDQDLRDQNNLAIPRREWRQPASGSYNTEQAEKQVYQTNNNVQNERKVYIFYGLQLANTGLGRVGSGTFNASMVFKRASVKTIDIWHMDILETGIKAWARTPVIYKKNDNARIDAFPKTGASGLSDNVIILGKVVERTGDNIVG